MLRWAVLFGGLVLFLAHGGVARADGASDRRLATHEALSKLVLERTRLLSTTGAPVSVEAGFRILTQRGVMPRDGWHVGRLVTRGDLARVVVAIMGGTNAIAPTDDEGIWIQWLANRGIHIPTPCEIDPPAEASTSADAMRLCVMVSNPPGGPGTPPGLAFDDVLNVFCQGSAGPAPRPPPMTLGGDHDNHGNDPHGNCNPHDDRPRGR